MWEVPEPAQQYVQRPLPVTSLRDSASGDARLIKLVHVEVLDKSEATGSGRKRNRAVPGDAFADNHDDYLAAGLLQSIRLFADLNVCDLQDLFWINFQYKSSIFCIQTYKCSLHWHW